MTTQATWTNRITGLTLEEPSSLLAHPLNARIHPKPQQDVLSATIRDLGFLVPVIVNDTTQHTLDGHLRIEQAISDGQPTIPVIHVELPEELEAEALLTIDPIAALAVMDKANMDALLRQVETDSAELQAMLDQQAVRAGVVPPTDPNAEWQGMPAFEQPFNVADRKIVVSFASIEAVADFARLVGQPITDVTKGLWYPAQANVDRRGLGYVDAEACDEA